jgi:hypothetical protein
MIDLETVKSGFGLFVRHLPDIEHIKHATEALEGVAVVTAFSKKAREVVSNFGFFRRKPKVAPKTSDAVTPPASPVQQAPVVPPVAPAVLAVQTPVSPSEAWTGQTAGEADLLDLLRPKAQSILLRILAPRFLVIAITAVIIWISTSAVDEVVKSVLGLKTDNDSGVIRLGLIPVALLVGGPVATYFATRLVLSFRQYSWLRTSFRRYPWLRTALQQFSWLRIRNEEKRFLQAFMDLASLRNSNNLRRGTSQLKADFEREEQYSKALRDSTS